MIPCKTTCICHVGYNFFYSDDVVQGSYRVDPFYEFFSSKKHRQDLQFQLLFFNWAFKLEKNCDSGSLQLAKFFVHPQCRTMRTAYSDWFLYRADQKKKIFFLHCTPILHVNQSSQTVHEFLHRSRCTQNSSYNYVFCV